MELAKRLTFFASKRGERRSLDATRFSGSNHTVSNQNAGVSQVGGGSGAPNERRGGRAERSGDRSTAEGGGRGLGGIDQDGARTNDVMRQYAPPY